MSLASPTSASQPVELSGSHTVAEAMATLFPELGVESPMAKFLADIPPWTEEEAAAFERAVNEAGGRIDEIHEWP